MMTAEQVRDVILAETKPPMPAWQLNEFVEQRFADLDPDIVDYGIRLACLELQRQAEQQMAEADELQRFKRNRWLRVV